MTTNLLRTTLPANWRSIFTRTTSSGAPLTRVTGTSYGIIAPLTNGIASIIDEGDFDAERQQRNIAFACITRIRARGST